MAGLTIVDFYTFNTLDQDRRWTMQEAELEFYKKAAISAATNADKMVDALKAGEVVTLGSSVFGGLRIVKEPKPEPKPEPAPASDPQ